MNMKQSTKNHPPIRDVGQGCQMNTVVSADRNPTFGELEPILVPPPQHNLSGTGLIDSDMNPSVMAVNNSESAYHGPVGGRDHQIVGTYPDPPIRLLKDHKIPLQAKRKLWTQQ